MYLYEKLWIKSLVVWQLCVELKSLAWLQQQRLASSSTVGTIDFIFLRVKMN